MNFNGVDLSSKFIVNDIRRDILPPRKLTTIDIPRKIGAYIFGSKYDPRIIEVDITIIATSPTDLRLKVRELAGLLDTDQPAPLIISDEPDKINYAMIDATQDLKETNKLAKATLRFFCPDPNANTIEQVSVVLDVPAPVFSRNCTATKLDGTTTVPAGEPVYETGQFGASIYMGDSDDRGRTVGDVLYIPTICGLTAEEGTIEGYFYEDGVLPTGYSSYIFSLSNSSTDINRVLLIKTVNTGNYTVWINNTQIFYTEPLSVGWKRFAIRWDGPKVDFFVDRVLRCTTTMESPVDFTGLENIYLGCAKDGSRQFNGRIEEFRFSNIARTDEELTNVNSTFTVDEATLFRMAFDSNLNTQSPGLVSNNGTDKSYPTITVEVTEDITSMALITSDEYLVLGQASQIDSVPIVRDQVLIEDKCQTLTGWSAVTPLDSMVQQGAVATTGDDFYVPDYGTGANWHGAAIKRSFAPTTQDFRAEFTTWFRAIDAGEIGRIDMYMLDVNGSIISKMTIADYWVMSESTIAEFNLGSGSNRKQIAYFGKYGSKEWNDFEGLVRIERKGNKWTCTVARVDPTIGKLYAMKTSSYFDTNGLYSAPVASVQLQFGSFQTYTKMGNQRVRDVRVYKINSTTKPEIPVIAQKGDVIEFDHKKAVVYKNGEPFMSDLDPMSTFFPLKKGANALMVRPLRKATVKVTHNLRWL